MQNCEISIKYKFSDKYFIVVVNYFKFVKKKIEKKCSILTPKFAE